MLRVEGGLAVGRGALLARWARPADMDPQVGMYWEDSGREDDDEEPEREGRSLATTHHQVIREWAEARGGSPATVAGTEHDDGLGVLRLDFGRDDDRLRPVSWEEWFDTFDKRKLNFVYQEQRSDGRTSTFFILESPDREDA